MSKTLTEEEISEALAGLPGWGYEKDALSKTFKFGTFREAMSFMVRVGFEAEAMNHHPDWSNSYSMVKIQLSTHDAGHKVTGLDLDLARRIQKVSWVA